jgi:hypothetical protein
MTAMTAVLCFGPIGHYTHHRHNAYESNERKWPQMEVSRGRPLYSHAVMNRHELMSVTAFGRTSLVVAASDGPGG